METKRNQNGSDIICNGRRLPTPILFGLNFPAVVQIQLSELNRRMPNGEMSEKQVSGMTYFDIFI